MERPIGPVVTGWTPPPRPEGLHLKGRFAQLGPVDAQADAAALWAQFSGADWVWDYLFEAPPADGNAFAAVMQANEDRARQPCYVIRQMDDPAPLGYACFWTVVPEMGSIEIGNVNLSPALQRTPAATEAFFLMTDWAFANGYRRMEWKCNALNMPSRRAAQRLGFSFEGIFRQHLIVKGRNRDTAWFAVTDSDWGAMREAYQTWLSDDNIGADGRQRQRLSALTAPHLVQRDPTL
ncbi:GNAT family N-acetyltransferase [Yoonia sp. 208BN28-4]|uniref:GNAT family N-acetyltransferase n=1 Tax=Yoonia sp. 208BN28-4 TaxID=3126505 RepID=UPI003098613C